MLRLSLKRRTLYVGQHGWRLEDGDTVSAQPWSQPAQSGQLAELLKAIAFPVGPRRLNVVLEHFWAPCLLVSYPPAIRSKEERQSYVQALFRDVYGIDASTWTLHLEPSVGGEPVFAAAIEHASLKALRECALTHQLRLTSVQASFCAIWNRFRAQMNVSQGALIHVADQRVTIGVWQGGRWLLVRTQVWSGHDQGEALISMLQLLLSGSGYEADAGICYVAGADRTLSFPVLEGWEFVRLEEASQVTS